MVSLYFREREKKSINSNCAIIECFFEELSGAERGAAIYKESSHKVEVVASFFLRCKAVLKGASISLEGGSFSYSKSCAQECTLTKFDDNNYGNHIYCDKQKEVVLADSEAFLCAPTREESGDSVIMIFTFEDLKVKVLNHSHCNTASGSSGISIYSQPNEPLDYITVYKGNVLHLHYIYHDSCTKALARHSIVIGGRFTHYVFYSQNEGCWEVSDSILLPEQCYEIFGSEKSKMLQNVKGNFSFIGITPITFYDVEIQNKRKGCTYLNTKTQLDLIHGLYKQIVCCLYLLQS